MCITFSIGMFVLYVLCTRLYLRRLHGFFFTRRQTRWKCIFNIEHLKEKAVDIFLFETDILIQPCLIQINMSILYFQLNLKINSVILQSRHACTLYFSLYHKFYFMDLERFRIEIVKNKLLDSSGVIIYSSLFHIVGFLFQKSQKQLHVDDLICQFFWI